MRDRVHPLLFWPPAILLVIAAACVLAAPVHDLARDLGLMRPGEDATALQQGFLQVLRRLVLVPVALLFLWWNRPWRGGLLRYGLRPTRARLRGATLAFGLTLLTLLLVLAWQLLEGWLRWEDPLRLGTFAGRVVRYLTVGLLIALLEEWFFRGWLGDFARRHHGPLGAVVWPCLAYGVAHAFRPTVLARSVSHDAAGALDAILGWLAFAGDVAAFGPALLGLFLFALLLTALYRRSGSLWPAVGVHLAGIVTLFSYGALTERAPARTWAGTRLLYDGPVVWIVLALAAWILWPRGASRHGDDSGAAPPPRTGSSAQ